MAYVIKRYSNRKLYDTENSRFITLDDVQALIHAGKEIRVVDADSGADLTSVTLAQILLESERHHQATLPSALLHQLIRHREAWQEIAQRSVRANLDRVAASQEGADRLFRQWVSAVTLDESKEHPPEKRNESASAQPPSDILDEVATLKERLRSLEQKLSNAQKTPKKKTRKTPPR